MKSFYVAAAALALFQSSAFAAIKAGWISPLAGHNCTVNNDCLIKWEATGHTEKEVFKISLKYGDPLKLETKTIATAVPIHTGQYVYAVPANVQNRTDYSICLQSSDGSFTDYSGRFTISGGPKATSPIYVAPVLPPTTPKHVEAAAPKKEDPKSAGMGMYTSSNSIVALLPISVLLMAW